MSRPRLLLCGVLLIGLVGCAATPPASGDAASSRGQVERTASAEAVTGLPFDAAMPEGSRLRWAAAVDPAAYEPISSDAARSTWREGVTGCEITVGQSGLGGLDVSGDERRLSDAVLAMALEVDPAEVSSAATDTALPLDGGGELAVRGVVSDYVSGSVEFSLGRAIHDPATAILVSAYCPPGVDAVRAMATFQSEALHLFVETG